MFQLWACRLIGSLTYGIESVGACWLKAWAKARGTYSSHIIMTLIIFFINFNCGSLRGKHVLCYSLCVSSKV